MKLQIFNSFKIFKNRRIFLKGQEIKFYKAYNTAAGNNIHSSWLETFKIMCADIEKIDFDLAKGIRTIRNKKNYSKEILFDAFSKFQLYQNNKEFVF